jgi:hypothetical protein
MAARKGSMPARRKEKQRAIEAPVVTAPPRGKKGSAAKTRIARTKEPLRSAQKVKN